MVHTVSSTTSKARELGIRAGRDPPYQSKDDFWAGFVRGDGNAQEIMENVK